ncbi:hypothetical protein Q3G72_016084 [Acer saccharum]|nr:hypothetical protein Q3G72_016084 [Acer saccharum]
MVNERHIWGQPVISKVAPYGWNKRQFLAISQGCLSKVDGEPRNVDGKKKGIHGGQQRNPTFAEAVSKNHDKYGNEGPNVTVNIKSMSWEDGLLLGQEEVVKDGMMGSPSDAKF